LVTEGTPKWGLGPQKGGGGGEKKNQGKTQWSHFFKKGGAQAKKERVTERARIKSFTKEDVGDPRNHAGRKKNTGRRKPYVLGKKSIDNVNRWVTFAIKRRKSEIGET